MKFNELTNKLKATRLVGLCKAIHSEFFPEGPEIKGQYNTPKRLINYSRRKIVNENNIEHDSLKGIIQSFYFTQISFTGIRYKYKIIRSYLFVSDYFGENRFFSSIPLFYFYGWAKLVKNSLKQ